VLTAAGLFGIQVSATSKRSECKVKGLPESDKFRAFLVEISEKWRAKWEAEGIFEADPEPGKPKMFLTAAYPYPNAPLHLGHALTYTIPDVIAKYKRMQGFNVLFPMGFHFTGTPVLTMSEAISRGDQSVIEQFTKLHGVPPEDIEKLKEPLSMAEYFRSWAERDLKGLLLGIDWRRTFTTVEPEYNKFIEWQFEKLRKKGFIVQGTHPVGWCPFHQSPVSMHDTIDDVEPEIQEFTLIYFIDEEDNTYYPAATLRPETVLGVTNIWVNPNARYVVASVDGKRLLLSAEAFYKVGFQRRNVEKEGELEGRSLVGKRVRNPVTGKVVPVFDSMFVDPDTGTGIVMSVPAHAPYDYVALREASERQDGVGLEARKLKPIPLIRVVGYSELPAKDVVERAGVKSTSERELLDSITKRVYLEEHERGVMREDLASLVEESEREAREFIERNIAGKPVGIVREKIVAWLKAHGLADSLYELANKPVYCRCGTKVVVKVLEDQWFVDYENSEWKAAVKMALERVEIIPDDYRPQFYHTVDWLKKKACARSRGLGTKLPWDRRWIIESLSDSTIYMAFYTIIHKIRKHDIRPESLIEEFWDYVFLGSGDPLEVSKRSGVPVEVLRSLREEFLYWYPLDNRHSGKDLVPNHLTFMMFNHVAIFPEELWPRRIVVNGHIMVEGEKMSKSKGNIVPLHKALAIAGPDVLRLSLITAAEIGKDVNFTKELIEAILRRLERIYELATRVFSVETKAESHDLDFVDQVLASKFHIRHLEATESLEACRLRQASVIVFSLIDSDIREYLELKDRPNHELLRALFRAWIRMMAPFTPAFAEELWHLAGSEESVFNAQWPRPSEIPFYPKSLLSHYLSEMVLEDINSILRASKRRANGATVVVASREKQSVMKELVLGVSTGRTLEDLARTVAPKWMVKRPIEAVKEVVERVSILPQSLRDLLATGIDEAELLKTAAQVLERKLGFAIEILREEAERQQPFRREPLPLKPAIILELE